MSCSRVSLAAAQEIRNSCGCSPPSQRLTLRPGRSSGWTGALSNAWLAQCLAQPAPLAGTLETARPLPGAGSGVCEEDNVPYLPSSWVTAWAEVCRCHKLSTFGLELLYTFTGRPRLSL